MIGVAIVAASLVGSIAAAGGNKARECKPSGMPNALGQTGAVAVAQPVEYWSKPWLLVTDKPTRPDKVRLVSAGGEIIEIGKPPITVEPVVWLARGRAVYALGRGRSQIQGKTDVVLMRWGTDPRPRITILRTADVVDGALSAAFTNEFFAATWAEKSKDGSMRRYASFLDIEDPKIKEPVDLGPDSGAAARVQALIKGFALVWASSEGLRTATFDSWGKPVGATKTMAWKGQPTALSVVQCAERTWIVRESGKELALVSGDAAGAMKELARVPMSPDKELMPVSCVDNQLVIARRTLDSKAGNVTFWISTVDATGKVRDRRVKDTRGTLDDIRMPQLSQTGAKLTSWWIEGQGQDAKVWSREISCD